MFKFAQWPLLVIKLQAPGSLMPTTQVSYPILMATADVRLEAYA